MKNLYRAARKAGIGLLRSLIPIAYGVPFQKGRRISAKDVKAPKRILLLNGAHIGDVVIATSLLPILRAAYPDAEVGFATASWSQMVIRNHPDIRYTHCIDHWRYNRGTDNIQHKKRHYQETLRRAMQEIKDLHYDVAISLFTHHPDFLDVAWSARIPVRIGFSKSIFAGLATDVVVDPDSPFVPQGARLAATLRVLPIEEELFSLRRSTLPPSNPAAEAEVYAVLGVSSLKDIHYRIIHMGTGAAQRELDPWFWRELAEKLRRGHRVLFTGHGAREHQKIEQVIHGLGNCVNACNVLSWEGFVAAVRHAEVLYGVESMAGHVAGAVGTKCVVVYGGTAGVGRWRPEGNGSLVMTNHVPCAPCLRVEGCAAMHCMKNIRPDDLVNLHV